MTIIARVNNQQVAISLVWVPLQNDKKISAELISHKGVSFVLRKATDKTRQLGIVTGSGIADSVVGAAAVSGWKPSDSTLMVFEAEKEDGSIVYWGTASADGKILPGSDILLLSTAEAAAWVKGLVDIYKFDVYLDSKISALLPDIASEALPDFTEIVKKHGKLKTSVKNNARSSAQGGSSSFLSATLVILLVVVGGGYYYYQSESNKIPQKIELTEQQKQEIIDTLTKEEAQILTEELAVDDFAVAVRYVDESILYPAIAVAWNVDTKTIDVRSRMLTAQWRMGPGGYRAQLESVRPLAQIIIDETGSSGKLALESIPLLVGESVYKSTHDDVTSKATVLRFLIDMEQKSNTKLTISGVAPLQTKTPPPNTGVVFNPTYSKVQFTFDGDKYVDLINVLDGLSMARNIKPAKITLTMHDITSINWKVEGAAYINNK